MMMSGASAHTLATLVTIAFAVVVIGVMIYYIREDLFHPLVLVGFLFSYYIILPAGSLLVDENLRWPDAFDDPTSALALALLVALAAYTLIVVGYWTAGRMLDGGRTHQSNTAHRVAPKALVVVGLLGFAAGLVAYLYYVVINGGFARLLTITPRNAFQQVPNTGRYRLLGTAGVYSGLFVVYTGLRPRLTRSDISWSTGLTLAALTAVTLTVAVSLRSRMNIVLPAAFVLLYAHYAGVVSKRAIVGGVLALLVLGGGYTFFEHVAAGGATLAVLVRGFVDPIRFELLAITIQSVPSEHAYQGGGTLLWALPIRGSWLPLRYGDQLEVLAVGRNRPHLTFPATMLGELWLNFGPVGVGLGSAAFGALLRVVYRYRDGVDELVSGAYPLAFLAVLVALPTSIQFAIQSVLFRLFIPVLLAILVAAMLTSFSSQLSTTSIDQSRKKY